MSGPDTRMAEGAAAVTLAAVENQPVNELIVEIGRAHR